MREPSGDEQGELAHESTPARAYAGAEDARSLWTWMRGVLTERQHAALWLHYQENFSVRDAATAMRVTETHLKVLLHRARAVLQRELRNHPVWRECLAGLAAPSVPFCVPLQERRNMP
jgi:DNA-directed RNA polymerase specialized sigma24 family protein